MADAVETIAGTLRAGGRILVHGDYDVDGQCCHGAAHPRACAWPVPMCRPSCRIGCATATISGPPGWRRGQGLQRLAHHHLRLRYHGGGHRACRARGRHQCRGDRSPPARRRSCHRRSAVIDPQRGRRPLGRQQALRHRNRLQAGAGAGAGAWAAGQPSVPPARSRGARHRGRRGAARGREPDSGPARPQAAGRQQVAVASEPWSKPPGSPARRSSPATWVSCSVPGSMPRAGWRRHRWTPAAVE